MPWLLQLILHSWPSHSGNVENSAWPNTKRCLSNSPIFWVDSGWLFRIPMGSQKPNGHVEKTPKFYSFHQATPHGQGHRLRPRSSPRAAQAPVDPFQRLHLSKKSRSQVRIGRPRSMEYGTYMELIWNLYMESIWNSGIMTFIFVNFYVWNGMEWDRIQQKWNNLQNIIRQDPRPKQPKQNIPQIPDAWCRVAKWNQSEAHFLMFRAIPEASCSWFMMVFSNGIGCRTFHYINYQPQRTSALSLQRLSFRSQVYAKCFF